MHRGVHDVNVNRAGDGAADGEAAGGGRSPTTTGGHPFQKLGLASLTLVSALSLVYAACSPSVQAHVELVLPPSVSLGRSKRDAPVATCSVSSFD